MAAPTPDRFPAPKRRRLRRRYIIALVPVLIFALGWQAVERVINIERYRPLIDAELEKLTKLPLSFGAMDLQLLPTPRLVVENVALGEDQFMVFAPSVTVTASPLRLFRRQLALRLVDVHEAQIRLPEEIPAFRERWSAYMLSLNAPREPADGGGPGLNVTLDAIEAVNARVFRGQSLFAGGRLLVSGVTSGSPVFEFDGSGATATDAMTAQGAFTLDVNAENVIQGTAAVTGLPLAALTGDGKLPDFLLDADLDYVQTRDGAIATNATGQVRLDTAAEALGPFRLAARYASGDLTLNAIQVDTEPLDFLGAIEINRDRRWKLAIEEATLRGRGITWLAARLPAIPVAESPGLESRGVLRNVLMGDMSDAGYAFANGTIDLFGVGLRLGAYGYVLPGLDGAITIENDVYRLSGISNGSVEASGTVTADYANDRVSLDLTGELNLGPDLPLPAQATERLRLDAGTITIPALQAAFQGGLLEIPTLQGSAALDGGALSVLDRATQAYMPVTEISGDALIENGVIRINHLKSSDTTISGTLAPDAALERWVLSGQLASDLANPIWKTLSPAGAFTIKAGKLREMAIDGDFVRGQAAPPRLEVSAAIQDLSVDVHTGSYTDSIKLDSLGLTSAEGKIVFDAGGESAKLGPVAANGAYVLANGAVEALATLRPAAATTLPASYREGVSGAVLAAMGDLPLRLQYDGAGSAVRFSSETAAIQGELGFTDISGGRAPISLALSAAMPASWLAHVTPAVEPSGTIQITVDLARRDGRLSARADLKDASFAWSLFRKQAGFPAALTLAGAWGSGGLRLAGGRAEAGGEGADFLLSNGAITVDSFTVDLAPLAPLLPEGGSLAGRIGGAYDARKPAVSLRLDGVKAVLAPDIPALELQGEVRREETAWRVENLAWAAGESRGLFRATANAGIWSGRLEAERANLGELARGYRALNERRGISREEARPATPWNFTGTFDVTCAQLAWVNAVVQNARCTAEFSPGGFETTDFSFAHGEGRVSGAIGYRLARADAPPSATVDLAVTGVNAVLLEGLFVEKARDLAGTLDGRVVLDVPMIPENPSVLHAMSGEIEFQGVDGSLGKAGLASKLLAALRTTDLLRLRIPQLKDRGLTFKTLSGRVEIAHGVFHLKPFALADAAYVMESEAVFDFPKDTADGGGEVQVLEGVTGIARKIPILGGAANLVSKALGVPFKISGTAADPAFRVGIPRGSAEPDNM